MKNFFCFFCLGMAFILPVLGGCLPRPPLPPVPAPTPTALPCGAGAFTNVGSIGCKQNGLAVLKSQADWTAYQALPGCGTAVAGALDSFDFTDRMVVSYDYHACGSGADIGIRITNVCFYADRVEVNITRHFGDAVLVDPGFDPNALVQCNGDAVSIPRSDLPIVPIFCDWSGMTTFPSPCP